MENNNEEHKNFDDFIDNKNDENWYSSWFLESIPDEAIWDNSKMFNSAEKGLQVPRSIHKTKANVVPKFQSYINFSENKGHPVKPLDLPDFKTVQPCKFNDFSTCRNPKEAKSYFPMPNL